MSEARGALTGVGKDPNANAEFIGFSFAEIPFVMVLLMGVVDPGPFGVPNPPLIEPNGLVLVMDADPKGFID